MIHHSIKHFMGHSLSWCIQVSSLQFPENLVISLHSRLVQLGPGRSSFCAIWPLHLIQNAAAGFDFNLHKISQITPLTCLFQKHTVLVPAYLQELIKPCSATVSSILSLLSFWVSIMAQFDPPSFKVQVRQSWYPGGGMNFPWLFKWRLKIYCFTNHLL